MSYTILDVVPDSPEWYLKRREGLGASDSAAVLGLSKWATPLDVYRSKMGVERDFDPMLAWVGHHQEPVIAEWVREFHPEVLVGSDHMSAGIAVRSMDWPWLFATPDKIITDEESGLDYIIPVELKTSMEFAREGWADGVPLYYQVQVQQQIAVLGAPYGWLAVFHGGRDFELHKIPRDDEFIEQLVRITGEWWTDHVVAQVPPEPTTTGEVAELFKSVPETEIEASELAFDVHEQRKVLLADRKAIDDQLEPLEVALGNYMQTAETLTYQGRRVLTYKTQSGRRSVDMTALEQNYPEVAPHVIRQGNPFKVFRTVKEKP